MLIQGHIVILVGQIRIQIEFNVVLKKLESANIHAENIFEDDSYTGVSSPYTSARMLEWSHKNNCWWLRTSML